MITNLIIVLSVLLLLNVFFKPNRTMVFCGIFAFSGVRKITKEQLIKALYKIKILGLYNESRGGQGAGIFINDEIIKCGEKHKTFPDLLENNVLDLYTDNHLVLGHCRRMSRGIVSTENTHPFLINNDLIGIHNGTIENIYDLKREYKVETGTNYNDSFALYSIIEAKGTDVLKDYKGNAALIWSRLTDPNSLYLFHGASKVAKAGTVLEERPMFFMNTKEGLYFSSMESSLWAIREEDQIPEQVPFNNVIRVSYGKFVPNKSFKIDREEANVPVNFYNGVSAGSNVNAGRSAEDDWSDYYYGGSNDGAAGYNGFKGGANTPKAKIGEIRGIGQGVQLGIPIMSEKAAIEPTVWREIAPTRSANPEGGKQVYFHRGRYYSEPGMVCCGEIYIMKKGFICESENAHIVATAYYFYKGIMIQSKNAYDDLIGEIATGKLNINSPMSNFAMMLSRFSKYPITNLPTEGKEVPNEYRYKWYENSKPVSETFTPAFSSRHYKMSKQGYLLDIENAQKTNKEPTLAESFEEVRKLKVELNLGLIKEHHPLHIESKFNPNLKDKYLDSNYISFEECYKAMPLNYLDALLLFINDRLRHEMTVDPDQQEIRDELSKYIRTSVSKRCTLREAIGDVDCVLDRYVETCSHPACHGNIDGDSEAIAASYNTTPISRDLRDLNEILAEVNEAKEDDEEDEDEAKRSARDKDDKAEDEVDEIIDIVRELNERVDTLSKNESAFAQKSAQILSSSLTSVKYNLGQVAEDFSKEELHNKLNNAINM